MNSLLRLLEMRQLNLKFDFRFLVTYGAGIGAILQSVFEYLDGNF